MLPASLWSHSPCCRPRDRGTGSSWHRGRLGERGFCVCRAWSFRRKALFVTKRTDIQIASLFAESFGGRGNSSVKTASLGRVSHNRLAVLVLTTKAPVNFSVWYCYSVGLRSVLRSDFAVPCNSSRCRCTQCTFSFLPSLAANEARGRVAEGVTVTEWGWLKRSPGNARAPLQCLPMATGSSQGAHPTLPSAGGICLGATR